MKSSLLAVVALVLVSGSSAFAVTNYVDINSINPVAPYTSWETAASNIQDAVDETVDGDTVLVADGHYILTSEVLITNAYGDVIYDAEVVITNDILLKSVNGRDVTILDANRSGRCLNLGSNACVVSGFTIQNGRVDYTTRPEPPEYNPYYYKGGGIYCDSNMPVITNCTVQNNGSNVGGGIYRGTAVDCTINRNGGGYTIERECFLGGGLYETIAIHCTISSNAVEYGTSRGGGLYGGIATNCLIQNNYAYGLGGGISDGIAINCVIQNNSAYGLGGGMSDGTAINCLIQNNGAFEPGGGVNGGTAINCSFIDNSSNEGGVGGMYAGTAQNCIFYAHDQSAMLGGIAQNCVFWDNEEPQYVGTIVTNCIESDPLFVDPANGNFRLLATSPCIDAGSDGAVTTSTDLDYNARIIDGDLDGTATVDMGAYEFQSATHYVDLNCQSPTPPYTSWEIAATNIQDAVDVSVDGDTVLVTNGHYYVKSEILHTSSRRTVAHNAEILVTNDIRIESVNGPEVTIIDADGTYRCFNLGTNACIVSGFTIQNGIAVDEKSLGLRFYGGGIYCDNNVPVVSNCILRKNFAEFGGGLHKGTAIDCMISENGGYGSVEGCFQGAGIFEGIAINCTISNNSAIHQSQMSSGGGMYGGMAIDSTIINNYASMWGGGLYQVTAVNCIIQSNTAGYGGGGGGMYAGSATNCIIIGNSAGYEGVGGGIAYGSAINCTIYGNESYYEGGGVYSGSISNCIAWNNSAGESTYYLSLTTARNTCSPDVIHGVDGNITNAPLFVNELAGNFRLMATSPCIDAGNNAYVTTETDLNGNPRIIDGDMDGTATVDMGAYEFQLMLIPEIIIPPINLKSKGRTPMTVLSTDDFDASSIDSSTVRLAGAAPVKYVQHATDLKLFFNAADLEINPEDTTAVLIGQTDTGTLVVGVVPIQLVP